jgi:hypothetical protein
MSRVSLLHISSRQGRVFGAGFLACVVLGFVWYSTGEPNGQATHRGDPVGGPVGGGATGATTSDAPVVARVSRRVRARFSVLRTREEGLPRGITKLLRRPTHGLNWQLAQVLPSTDGIPFWVVPGRGVMCLVGQEDANSVTTVCTRSRDALRQGLSVALLRPDRQGRPAHRLIVGLAPDGTRTIRIFTRDETTAAQVFNGFFVARDGVMDPPDRLVLHPAPSRPLQTAR